MVLLRLLVLVSLSGGCSFVFMEKLDSDWEPLHGEPRCTASDGFSTWDTVLAISDTIGAGWAFYSANQAGEVEGAQELKPPLLVLGVVSAVLAATHVASAISGSTEAARCRDARKERDRWVRERDYRNSNGWPSADEHHTYAVPVPPEELVDAGVADSGVGPGMGLGLGEEDQ